ncbi:hypothetical protein B566_EDAN014005 [Ephemera danica]|nr:hypothetical protein B566_EDAN014005 [Ephemera danica]
MIHEEKSFLCATMSAEQNSNSTVESSQTLIIESGDEENQSRFVIVFSVTMQRFVKMQRILQIWKRISLGQHRTLSSKTKISPLSGIRILDLTRIVAGPFCTMILGDLGADVIKIEHPDGGDECRKWGPPFMNGSESVYFLPINRNKRSVCINLKSKEGIAVIQELSKSCDVLMENFLPGKLASLGLGYEQLKQLNSRLIYVSLTGYGPDGPYSNRPGYDVIAASEGGLVGITGPSEGDPCKVGVAMTDLASGLFAHGAILAALFQRLKTNEGQKIDVDLLSTQVACLINIGSNYLNAGIEAKRLGTSHASLVPYESFKTLEGGYVTVCSGSDSQFQDLCRRIGLPELATEPRYKNNGLRVENRNELVSILRKKFLSQDSDYWLDTLKGGLSPYGRVNSLQQVFDDPHIKAIELVKTLEHPTAGQIKLVGPHVKFSVAANEVHRPPPVLGQHTEEVLKEVLHYSDEKEVPTLRLRLRKPKSQKQVKFDASTVDNEHLNKKKSKCCCIYTKPHKFGESSSESEDECDNCYGHVEKRHRSHQPSDPSPQEEGPSDHTPITGP